PSTTTCGMRESRHSGQFAATTAARLPDSAGRSGANRRPGCPLGSRAIRRRTGRYGAPMLSQRKRLLILAVPVAVSLALAGPASAADSKGDRAILKGGVITKADVPAEWTSKPSKSSSDALKGLKKCRKINTAVAAAKKDE